MNRRSIGFHGCLERLRIRLGLIILFPRNHALFDQRAVSFCFDLTKSRLSEILGEIRFRLFLQGQIFRHVRLCLAQIRFKRTRVDREEQLTFLHVRAVGEMNLQDASGNLRLNRHHFARDGFPDRVNIVRHILHDRFSHRYRRRRPFKALLCSLVCAAGEESGRQAHQVKPGLKTGTRSLFVSHRCNWQIRFADSR